MFYFVLFYIVGWSWFLSDVKKGIPHGEALRVRRKLFVIQMRFLIKDLRNLKGFFLKEVLRESMIVNQFKKAKAKKRDDIVYQDTTENRLVKRMWLVLNFHSALSGIGKIIHLLWPI